jgi:hypothetical protein
VSGLIQDLRQSMRFLWSRPRFTSVIVLTLGLAIGFNVALFTVLNALLLRPLPYERPQELVSFEGLTRKSTCGSNKVVLEATWGEAEFLMNLAFANVNRATPDLAAAKQYAQRPLGLVPYWRYVRDILLPQIRKAREKSNPTQTSVRVAAEARYDPVALSLCRGVNEGNTAF